MNKKYELTQKTIINWGGKKLFRIKALVAFRGVEKDALGGFIDLSDGVKFSSGAIIKNDTSGKINVSVQVGETQGVYCDPFTLNYKLMKALDATCLEDFECASNVCVEGTCYSIRTELEAQRGIIQEILCLLRSIFTSQTRVQCLGNLTAGNLAPPTA